MLYITFRSERFICPAISNGKFICVGLKDGRTLALEPGAHVTAHIENPWDQTEDDKASTAKAVDKLTSGFDQKASLSESADIQLNP